MHKLITTIAVIFITVTASYATEPIAVGQDIPAISLTDQKGEAQTFESLKGENGAVLVFVRSADWCPYCQVQLLELRDIGDQVMENGYNIVTISYDAPETLKTFGDKYKFPYTMLSDPDSATIDAFGIRDESYKGREGIYGIPKPHVYVVNNAGVIQMILAEDSYKRRPSANDVLTATTGK